MPPFVKDIRWCIFYVDGTTFSNLNGEPEEAPGGGVAAIFQESRDVGVAVWKDCTLQGDNFYVFGAQFGGWYGVDHWGLAQYIIRGGFLIIKLGEVMPLEEFQALLVRIREDPNLPNKSARYNWEPPLT